MNTHKNHINIINSILITIGLLSSIPTQATPKYHSLEDILNTAKQFVLISLPSPSQESTVVTGKLDPRLRLHHCEDQLEAFFPETGRRIGNTTVGIRCNGPQNWSLYVPVKVNLFVELVVVTRPLTRGAIIQEEDIRIENRNISFRANDYYTDTNEVIGMELVRSVQHGSPITTNLLKAPTVVKRGESVTLLAKNSTFEVRMEGKAMMDGRIGERIKVRNKRSKRVVEGTVKSNRIIYIE